MNVLIILQEVAIIKETPDMCHVSGANNANDIEENVLINHGNLELLQW